jgi:hypothetical protein
MKMMFVNMKIAVTILYFYLYRQEMFHAWVVTEIASDLHLPSPEIHFRDTTVNNIPIFMACMV